MLIIYRIPDCVIEYIYEHNCRKPFDLIIPKTRTDNNPLVYRDMDLQSTEESKGKGNALAGPSSS
jgi:hypothetical protein